jgi:hypothetical protein
MKSTSQFRDSEDNSHCRCGIFVFFLALELSSGIAVLPPLIQYLGKLFAFFSSPVPSLHVFRQLKEPIPIDLF